VCKAENTTAICESSVQKMWEHLRPVRGIVLFLQLLVTHHFTVYLMMSESLCQWNHMLTQLLTDGVIVHPCRITVRPQTDLLGAASKNGRKTATQ
jgi:hypothetical protein